jgi:peptidyl-prolyl cis-trans isomerase SurA
MKASLLLLCGLLAAPLAAQSTDRPPAARPATADTTGVIPIDRIAAIVGERAITWNEVLELINQRRAAGLKVPTDSAGQMELARQVANEEIDAEVLVQKAQEEKVEVADADLQTEVDQRLKQARDQFKSDGEFSAALRQEGFGTSEEFRRFLTEQARRRLLTQKLVQKLKTDGKLVQVGVTDAEVEDAFEKNKATLPKRPATVTFRQIVVAPQASAAAKAAAKAKAESLLVEIKKGADFELVAKRESMDEGSKSTGGDLGWNRRDQMVPEFSQWMFALQPGQLSPVIETGYGYHIIKVERVRPAEVKARHILIKPALDSADVAHAKLRADTALMLWKKGTPFDTLVARYHDIRGDELKGSLDPFERDKLPESYRAAFADKGSGAFIDPFPIADPAHPGAFKYVVAQIIEAREGGDFTLTDFRTSIRDQLQQERAMRRLIDQLRKETYVSIRI